MIKKEDLETERNISELGGIFIIFENIL